MDLEDFIGVSSQGDDSGKLDGFPELKMFGILRLDRAGNTLPAHYNTGIEISYCAEGEFQWQVEGRRLTLRPGDACITAPWDYHGGIDGAMHVGLGAWVILSPCSLDPAEALAFGPWSRIGAEDAARIRELLDDPASPRVIHCPAAGRIFTDLGRELQLRPFGFRIRVHGLLDELLLETTRSIQETVSGSEAMPPALRDVLAAMAKAPGKSWSIARLSQMTGLKTTALHNWFRRAVGLTPREYLIRLRVDQARVLLGDTDRSVTDIALSLGFASSQHFADCFRRFVSVTPSAYRLALNALQQKAGPGSPIQFMPPGPSAYRLALNALQQKAGPGIPIQFGPPEK